ncbi:MAG TPA: epoxide hydrolase [Acidimicrobiales bacterium]|nr:epoxide hydrolase [Acidimicrobiales bacterium]
MSDEVLPFRVEVPEGDLRDLRERLARTRWPEPATVGDWSQGVPLDYVKALCRHWSDGYDWRAREARLNELAQFRTEIDGLGIHFLHVRSPEPEALPLVLTHGWPGSIVEFQEVVGPLTDPVAHGGDPADAFHVVVPSLPGYGWSDKPATTGWGIERIAEAWGTLMARLGYDRYGAQGGDWGAGVTTRLGIQDPGHLAGIHLNLVAARPEPGQREFDEEEQRAIADLAHYTEWESGYSQQQATRPQTLGYALTDSPAGQCAWILEKFRSWADCGDDPVGAFGADRLLDNIMVYWLSSSASSSARLYWQSFRSMVGTQPVDVPTGASVFPKEIIRSPRKWAERIYTDLRYWNELDRGGHFAAFEQPELFVNEVRAFFRLVR